MAHAFVVVGGLEEGIERARSYVSERLGKGVEDVTVFRYGLLSVEDARRIKELVSTTSRDARGRALIIATTRFFHEAQNALLKTFEEPPVGTLLILVVPSEGVLLPTLRSRLLVLSSTQGVAERNNVYALSASFISSAETARTKLIEKILTDAKSDVQEKKDKAREDARLLVAGLQAYAYEMYTQKPSRELEAFLKDTEEFMPMLFERSAPLKPILEHVHMVFGELP